MALEPGRTGSHLSGFYQPSAPAGPRTNRPAWPGAAWASVIREASRQLRRATQSEDDCIGGKVARKSRQLVGKGSEIQKLDLSRLP